MHRLSTFLMTSFLAASLTQIGAAQQATENQQGGVPQHLGLETIVGCLSKGPQGTYNLTGGAPGPKVFRIISGETPEMKRWVGEDVEVLGIVGVGPAHQQGPYATTGVQYWTLKAEKVKELGGLCSNAGQEWPGDHFNRK
jgi:hypothetical protein